MNDGDIPVFKIYDTSENTYVTATSSEYVPWYSSMTEVVDILYSSLDIGGVLIRLLVIMILTQIFQMVLVNIVHVKLTLKLLIRGIQIMMAY